MGAAQGRSMVAVLAVGAAVAAGCGSSSSSGLNKQQLASRANAICTSFKPKLAAVKAPSDIAENPASSARYFGQVGALYNQAIGELKGLKATSNVEAQWSQMLSRFSALTSVIDQLKTESQNRSRSAATLSQVVPRTNAADAAARQVGAIACASTPTQ